MSKNSTPSVQLMQTLEMLQSLGFKQSPVVHRYSIIMAQPDQPNKFLKISMSTPDPTITLYLDDEVYYSAFSELCLIQRFAEWLSI